MPEIQKPQIADLVISGPVDGTNEDHPLGSYYRFTITPKGGKPMKFLISETCAESEFWIIGAGMPDEDN